MLPDAQTFCRQRVAALSGEDERSSGPKRIFFFHAQTYRDTRVVRPRLSSPDGSGGFTRFIGFHRDRRTCAPVQWTAKSYAWVFGSCCGMFMTVERCRVHRVRDGSLSEVTEKRAHLIVCGRGNTYVTHYDRTKTWLCGRPNAVILSVRSWFFPPPPNIRGALVNNVRTCRLPCASPITIVTVCDAVRRAGASSVDDRACSYAYALA